MKKYSVSICNGPQCNDRPSRKDMRRELFVRFGLEENKPTSSSVEVKSCPCLSHCEQGVNVKVEDHVKDTSSILTSMTPSKMTELIKNLLREENIL